MKIAMSGWCKTVGQNGLKRAFRIHSRSSVLRNHCSTSELRRRAYSDSAQDYRLRAHPDWQFASSCPGGRQRTDRLSSRARSPSLAVAAATTRLSGNRRLNDFVGDMECSLFARRNFSFSFSMAAAACGRISRRHPGRVARRAASSASGPPGGEARASHGCRCPW